MYVLDACTYTGAFPGDAPIFLATSRMHHLRDILRRYRRRDVLRRASFLPLPLYEHARYIDSKASSIPYERNQPARAVTVYDNYYNSTVSVPLFLFFLSFDVACPCREPRLAKFLAKGGRLSFTIRARETTRLVWQYFNTLNIFYFVREIFFKRYTYGNNVLWN